MFHQDGHHYIDEDELRHQHEDHKEDGRNQRADAAIGQTLLWGVAVISQGVLTQHNEFIFNKFISSNLMRLRKNFEIHQELKRNWG